MTSLCARLLRVLNDYFWSKVLLLFDSSSKTSILGVTCSSFIFPSRFILVFAFVFLVYSLLYFGIKIEKPFCCLYSRGLFISTFIFNRTYVEREISVSYESILFFCWGLSVQKFYFVFFNSLLSEILFYCYFVLIFYEFLVPLIHFLLTFYLHYFKSFQQRVDSKVFTHKLSFLRSIVLSSTEHSFNKFSFLI